MGPGRSLLALHSKYTESIQKLPPTASKATLKRWSGRNGWSGRAEEWDANAEERKTAAYDEAMKAGLALDYERVIGLKRIALFLDEQIYEQGTDGKYHNVWLPDVKSVGYGDFAQIVDIERFNAAIIQQYRGVLDDLAKETGGRVEKKEISGRGGGDLIFHVIYDKEEPGE